MRATCDAVKIGPAEANATGVHLSYPRTHTITPSATDAVAPVPRQAYDANSAFRSPTKKLQRNPGDISFYIPFWRGNVHEVDEGDILLPYDQMTGGEIVMRRAGDRNASKELTTIQTQLFECTDHPKSRSIATTNEHWNFRCEPKGEVRCQKRDGMNGVGAKVVGQCLDRDKNQPSTPAQGRRPLRAEPTIVIAETRATPASIVGQVQFPSRAAPIPIRQGKRLGPEGTEIIDPGTYTPPERDSVYPESS